ncbi:hypothetical protein [Microtetraspora malaysiensis]|uniref:hypothetical protein n=1 Tax=Microtetraspora malaysiensis TaxID=161358 RepID=UPI003D8C29A1
MPGLHFHDLRHTGNMLAAESGAGLKGLMGADGTRQRQGGHDLSARGTGADKAITDAIDKHINRASDEGEGGSAGALVPVG